MDRPAFSTSKGVSLKKFYDTLDEALDEGGFTAAEEAILQKVKARLSRSFYSTRLSFWFDYKTVDKVATSEAAAELRERMLEHWSEDVCVHCGKGSRPGEELLCCEGIGRFDAECSRVAHLKCAGLTSVPSGPWYHSSSCKPSANRKRAREEGAQAKSKRAKTTDDSDSSDDGSFAEALRSTPQGRRKTSKPISKTPRGTGSAAGAAKRIPPRPASAQPSRTASLASPSSSPAKANASGRGAAAADTAGMFQLSERDPIFPIFRDPQVTTGTGVLRLGLNAIQEKRSSALRHVLNDLALLKMQHPENAEVQEAYDKIHRLYNAPTSALINECSRIVQEIEEEEASVDQEISQLHAWVLKSAAERY